MLQDKLNLLSSSKECREQNIAMLFTICWTIWKGRNSKLFEDHEPQPDFALSTAIRLAYENFTDSNSRKLPDSRNHSNFLATRRTTWLPPPEVLVQAKVDVSFDEPISLCSIRVLLRDDQGTVLSGSARILPAISPLHTESLALKEAHVLASNLNIKSIIFESDNQDLIATCKNKEKHWQIHPIIQEIESLRQKFDTVAY